MSFIKSKILSLIEALKLTSEDELLLSAWQKAAELLVNTVKNGNKILIAGNGGSMADAMHFAEELTGRYYKNRPALPAIAIADPTHISCTANDFGYDHIFSRYIEALGKPNDVFIGLSTSGNSTNIINAINIANSNNLKTIALLAKGGGKAKGLATIEIIVPTDSTDIAQEVHKKLLHSFIEYIERQLYPNLYT